MAVEAGASGLIVYNSLKGIYQNKTYASPMDYECKYGQGYVNRIISPVWSEQMTASMPVSCTGNEDCLSGVCVLTNKTTSKGHQVCCAFDMYVAMAGSSTRHQRTRKYAASPLDHQYAIPVVFIRLRDAKSLLQKVSVVYEDLLVYMYSRYEPFIDPSSILIWLLAVFVVAYGALKAAGDEQKETYERFSSRRVAGSQGGGEGSTGTGNAGDEGSFEVSGKHAVIWALCSSAMLILLFYVNLYRFITVFFLIAAAVASYTVIFHPLLSLSLVHHDHLQDGIRHVSSKAMAAICAVSLVLLWAATA